MRIRPAAAGEEQRLAELNAIVQDLHRQAAPEWFKPPDLGAIAGYFAGLLASDTAHVFVAEDAGEIRGYALAQVHERPENALTYGGTVVELDQICVTPAARRTGIATGLVARVRELARALGATRVQLTVWEFNEPARTTFERAGFTTQTRRMLAEP